MFFIAVEFDGRAVVSHVGESISYLLLLTFSKHTLLSANPIIGSSSKGADKVMPDVVQVGDAHVVVDVGDAPRVAFLVVGREEGGRAARRLSRPG